MATERTEVPLEFVAAQVRNALVGGPFGSDLVSSDYSPAGVAVIRGENLEGKRWVGGDFVFVTAEKAARLAANTAGPLDVVFTQRGANHYRQVAVVPPGSERMVISQSQMKLTVDPAKADPLFVYYAFRSPQLQGYLQQHAIQTGVPHTNLAILRRAPIPLPPLPAQRAIVGILGALDDKIELNRQMVRTLRTAAEMIGQAAELKGARQSLGSLGELQRGFGYRSEGFGPDGQPMVSMGSTERRGWLIRSKLRPYAHSVPERYAIGPWDMLVVNVDLTWKLDVLGWPLIVPTDVRTAVFSSDVFTFRFRQSDRWLRTLVWSYLRSPAAREVIEGAAKGTTVASISAADLKSLEIGIPQDDAGREMLEHASDLIERAWCAERESDALASIRDTILPRLVSGEIPFEQPMREPEAVPT